MEIVKDKTFKKLDFYRAWLGSYMKLREVSMNFFGGVFKM